MNIDDLNVLIDEVNEGLQFIETEMETHPVFDSLIDKTAVSNAYHHAESLLSEIQQNGVCKNDVQLINQLAQCDALNPKHYSTAKSLIGDEVALEKVGSIINDAFDSLSSLLLKIWKFILDLVTKIASKAMEYSTKAVDAFSKLLSRGKPEANAALLRLTKKRHVDLFHTKFYTEDMVAWVDDSRQLVTNFAEWYDLTAVKWTDAVMNHKGSAMTKDLIVENNLILARHNKLSNDPALIVLVDLLKRFEIIPNSYRLDNKSIWQLTKTFGQKWSEYKNTSDTSANTPVSMESVEWDNIGYFDSKGLRRTDIATLLTTLDKVSASVNNLSFTKKQSLSFKGEETTIKSGKSLPNHVRKQIFNFKELVVKETELVRFLVMVMMDVLSWQTEIRMTVVKGRGKAEQNYTIAGKIITTLGAENIVSVEGCITRIRIKVNSNEDLKLNALKVKHYLIAKDQVQLQYGVESSDIADAMNQLLKSN